MGAARGSKGSQPHPAKGLLFDAGFRGRVSLKKLPLLEYETDDVICCFREKYLKILACALGARTESRISLN